MKIDRHLKRDENDIHAFIVRVWYEAVDGKGKLTRLRGVVEKVDNNQRSYFQDLNEIGDLINKQLDPKSGSEIS